VGLLETIPSSQNIIIKTKENAKMERGNGPREGKLKFAIAVVGFFTKPLGDCVVRLLARELSHFS
jgi:hypothetical protein